MPSKRIVVELFDKNELQSIVAEYDLAVADKRVKDQLIDAVASSKKATLEAVLPAFSRDRLKALCRTLGLDPSGREKAALIERLTGKPSRVPPPSTKGRSVKKKTKAANNNNTSADFEKNLWDTANKLRGTVESSEYKHVVLSLIFLKFISDKFEERRAQLIAEGKGSYLDMVEFYAMKSVFYLPEEARWRFVKDRAKQDDIAIWVDSALHTVEKFNKSLQGALPVLRILLNGSSDRSCGRNRNTRKRRFGLTVFVRRTRARARVSYCGGLRSSLQRQRLLFSDAPRTDRVDRLGPTPLHFKFYTYSEKPELLGVRTNIDAGMTWEIHPVFREVLDIKRNSKKKSS